jgi:hypothetical protein
MLLIAAVIFHSWRQANRHYCFEWREQSEASNCLYDLVMMHPKNPAIHTWIGGVYLGYYRVIDKSIAKLSPSGIDEEKLKSCTPADIKKIAQFDYIIVSSPTTLDCMNRNNISFQIIKEYKYTPDKLIKLNSP